MILIFTVCHVLSSCKKINNKLPVYKYHEISAPNSDTVLSISFPDLYCGYVITNAGFFKTMNAGQNWTFLDQTNQGIIQFHNRNFGVLPNGRITTDGGLTWTVNAPFEYACMTAEGKVIALDKLSKDYSLMYETDPLDTVFHFIDTIGYYGLNSVVAPKVSRIESHMGYMIIIPLDIAYDPIIGYSYNTPGYFQLINDWTDAEKPVDICSGFGEFKTCGGQGYIGSVNLPENENEANALVYPNRNYHAHKNDYYAIDRFEDFYIAVGRNSIVTTKEFKKEGNTFKEVLDADKNPFNETFYIVDIIDQNTFVVAASGGKIYYGTFD
ncbi:MAG: hypothetical protein IPO32_19825 [Crocinitomicaceae bacterium]|nr:hypothetical protein [Crocinitomicaceae bacterium]